MARTKAEQHAANIRRAKLVIDVEDMSLSQLLYHLDMDTEFPVVIINAMKNRARKNGDTLYSWILKQVKEPPKLTRRNPHENQEDLYKALNVIDPKK
jgi:hypothetical protein